jgi:hypothetical protein
VAHKILTTPTSGADPTLSYGVDWNKLIDHLEGRLSSDPFTLNVDHHVFKHSTTNVAGDLLKGDGTRFNRWAKGTASQQIRVNSSGTDLEWFTPSGAGGGGGGLQASGVATFSGDGSTKVFNIAHGIGATPGFISAEPASDHALGEFKRSKDATNIIITYAVAPPTGTNNVVLEWGASSVDAGTGFTATSVTTITNKTVGDKLTFNKVTTPADQTDVETGLIYFKEIDANNNTYATKQQIGGSIVEVTDF